MKHYRILKDFNGSQHGNDFQAFKSDTVEPLSDSLATIALNEGWAEPAEPKSAPEPEAKAIDEAPENKAIAKAPENKSKKKR